MPQTATGTFELVYVEYEQRREIRLAMLPRCSGSGTGSTQPREDNRGATWMEK
jgi:hypothetical protein